MNILANIYKDYPTTYQERAQARGDNFSNAIHCMLKRSIQAVKLGSLGVRINGEYLSNLRFAYEIVLLSNNGDELQSMIEDLNRESVRVGLKISMQKTNRMFNSLAKA